MPIFFAYLDPGAGSMIFQALLAGALALPLFFRSKVSAVVRRLTGRRDDDSSQSLAADEAAQD